MIACLIDSLKKLWTSIKYYLFNTIEYMRVYSLKIFGLNSSECESLKLVADTKKRSAYNWYFNNVIFSVITIFTLIIFTVIHDNFGTVAYNKSLLDIALSGGLSLTGLNILRSASTMISEKIDESKAYETKKEAWNQVKQEIFMIKNKLTIAVFVLTITGTLSYIFQVIAIVNKSNNAVYWFLIGFIIIFVFSILIGRSLYLMNTNFVDNDDIITKWHSKLQDRNKSVVEDLSKQTREGGL